MRTRDGRVQTGERRLKALPEQVEGPPDSHLPGVHSLVVSSAPVVSPISACRVSFRPVRKVLEGETGVHKNNVDDYLHTPKLKSINK